MSENEIFLTLPSNSNNKMFPNNKPNKYSVKLAQRLDFGKYEGALVGIQYPNSWFNVSDVRFFIMYPNNGGNRMVTLLNRKYLSVTDFVEDLNKELDDLHIGEDIKFDHDENQMKTVLEIKDHYVVSLSTELSNILGFAKRSMSKGEHLAKRHADIDEGMTAFYVYSDIVQNQMVGDSMVPLLRVVPLTGDRRKRYHNVEFKHARFIPLKNETTDIINIDIRRDDGDEVLFNTGKVITTLHLRPRAK